MKKIIITISIIASIDFLFSCKNMPKKSSLIDGPCTPFPCKMALEYSRQEYQGKKEMNGVLINWYKDTFRQDEYIKCKKEQREKNK